MESVQRTFVESRVRPCPIPFAWATLCCEDVLAIHALRAGLWVAEWPRIPVEVIGVCYARSLLVPRAQSPARARPRVRIYGSYCVYVYMNDCKYP